MTTQKGEREEALELLLDEFEDAVIAKAESLMVWRRRRGGERDDARQALKDFLLSCSKAEGEMREALEWTPLEGFPRDALPGRHLAWIVGSCGHSGVSWRREGCAILALSNDGPHGYSMATMRAAMRELDMQYVDAVTHFRRLPLQPAALTPKEGA